MKTLGLYLLKKITACIIVLIVILNAFLAFSETHFFAHASSDERVYLTCENKKNEISAAVSEKLGFLGVAHKELAWSNNEFSETIKTESCFQIHFQIELGSKTDLTVYCYDPQDNDSLGYVINKMFEMKKIKSECSIPKKGSVEYSYLVSVAQNDNIVIKGNVKREDLSLVSEIIAKGSFEALRKKLNDNEWYELLLNTEIGDVFSSDVPTNSPVEESSEEKVESSEVTSSNYDESNAIDESETETSVPEESVNDSEGEQNGSLEGENGTKSVLKSILKIVGIIFGAFFVIVLFVILLAILSSKRFSLRKKNSKQAHSTRIEKQEKRKKKTNYQKTSFKFKANREELKAMVNELCDPFPLNEIGSHKKSSEDFGNKRIASEDSCVKHGNGEANKSTQAETSISSKENTAPNENETVIPKEEIKPPIPLLNGEFNAILRRALSKKLVRRDSLNGRQEKILLIETLKIYFLETSDQPDTPFLVCDDKMLLINPSALMSQNDGAYCIASEQFDKIVQSNAFEIKGNYSDRAKITPAKLEYASNGCYSVTEKGIIEFL